MFTLNLRRSSGFCVGLLLTLIIVPGVAANEFKQAVEAYKRADFQTATSLFEDLAKQGDKRAQFALGLLYDNGEGVPEDDPTSRHLVYA